MSKTRNQACVQLVGLRDQALCVAKRLMRRGLTKKTRKSASTSAATIFRA
jgi:hypothetical protein